MGSHCAFLQVSESVAGAHGANVTIQWRTIPYIPLINDEGMVNLVERVAQKMAPRSTWQRLPEPNMAGEDFAFFAGNFTLSSSMLPFSHQWDTLQAEFNGMKVVESLHVYLSVDNIL